MNAEVKTFYDERSGTATHVIHCPHSNICAVIDPVFDLDPKSGQTSRKLVDGIIEFIRENSLQLDWILETHIHHDHISGAAALQDAVGGKIAIGGRARDVTGVIARVYGLSDLARRPGGFDRMLEDGERLDVGKLVVEAVATPGHTADHMSYVTGNAVFTGDTLFMPDSGTARCDFHGGDPHRLFRSIQRILDRPPTDRLLLCHDYGGDGKREAEWESTVAEQRSRNIHIGNGRSEAEFVELRRKRDATLDMPALLLHSLPLNIQAGRLPAPSDNGRVMLTIPLDVPRSAI